MPPRKSDPSDAKATLSLEQAERAIYIDFEGRKGETPALLGVLYAEGRAASPGRLVLRQDVLDESLWPLVGEVQLSSNARYETSVRTLTQAMHDVLLRAEAQSRHVVSWSQYERTTILGHDLGARDEILFLRWYRDGKATARRWRVAVHPDVRFQFDSRRGAHQLTRYLELIDYELPASYGSSRVGEWIRDTRDTLAKRHEFDAFTALSVRVT
jgi:hypothetical protein